MQKKGKEKDKEAGGHRGPKGAVANEDLPWDPCKRTCIFNNCLIRRPCLLGIQ